MLKEDLEVNTQWRTSRCWLGALVARKSKMRTLSICVYLATIIACSDNSAGIEVDPPDAATGDSRVLVFGDAEATDAASPEPTSDAKVGPTQGRLGADPTAFVDSSGKLHMYSTSRAGNNVPHLGADNPLRIDLVQTVGESLPDSQRGAELAQGVWAPSVAQIGVKYVMWYSGEVASSGDKCLWRATSNTPDGPFMRVGDGKPICPHPNWNIDPHVMNHAKRVWLYSKVGGNLAERELDTDGVMFAAGSSWEVKLSPTPGWEQGMIQPFPIIENPAMVQLSANGGQKRWFLFYSANNWMTRNYAMGYADCGGNALPGSCTKQTARAPWLAASNAEGPLGPGGGSFFEHNGFTYLILHGWDNACNDPSDTCATRAELACPAASKDLDCRYENPQGRRMYLYRMSLSASGKPLAKRM
jgi:arabinan endo-1,5-alpha-L-arabinosidase